MGSTGDAHSTSSVRVTAAEALDRLIAGNGRFVTGTVGLDSSARRYRQLDPDADQRPFAVILGCSDSRAPVELVFDQGLGDLFVIRVAGNIVAPSQIGSVEYAAEQLGARFVVVLGHLRCGAVKAALDSIEQGSGSMSRHQLSIIDAITPSIEGLRHSELRRDRKALLAAAVRANTLASVRHLKEGSRLLHDLMVKDGLHIVGADYDFTTRKVEFLEAPRA